MTTPGADAMEILCDLCLEDASGRRFEQTLIIEADTYGVAVSLAEERVRSRLLDPSQIIEINLQASTASPCRCKQIATPSPNTITAEYALRETVRMRSECEAPWTSVKNAWAALIWQLK